jgi:hypothetical protein
VLGKDVTHIGRSAIPVVGRGFDDDGDASGTVRFIADFHEVAAGFLAGSLADGGFDLVPGQVDGLRGGDGRAQARIGRRVAAAFGGDDDLFCRLGEKPAALGVLPSFSVLDVRPFAVPRHTDSLPCKP